MLCFVPPEVCTKEIWKKNKKFLNRPRNTNQIELSNYYKYANLIRNWQNMSSNNIRMVGMRMYAPIMIPNPPPPPGSNLGGPGGYIGSVPNPKSVPLKKVMLGLEGAIVFVCKLNEDSGKIVDPILLASSGHKINDETALELIKQTPKLQIPPVKLPYKRGLLVTFEPKNKIEVSIAPEKIHLKNYKVLSEKEFSKVFNEKYKLITLYMQKKNYTAASNVISELAELLRTNSLINERSLHYSNLVSYVVKMVIEAGSPQELMSVTQNLISACEMNTILGIRTFSFGSYGHHGGNDGLYCIDYSLVEDPNSKSLMDFIVKCKMKRLKENFLVNKTWSKSLNTLEKQMNEEKELK